MVKEMKKINKNMYVSELDEVNKDLIFNMLYEYAYRNEVESTSTFIDNGMNSRLSDLSDTIDISVIIERLERKGVK